MTSASTSGGRPARTVARVLGVRIVRLGRDECLALLAKTPLGRVAVTLGTLPVVRTVRFAVLDEGVVFKVGPSSSLRRSVPKAIVAFHADHYDEATREGWNLLVQGIGQEITEPRKIASLEKLGIPCWLSPAQDRYLMVPAQVVTGELVTWPEVPSS